MREAFIEDYLFSVRSFVIDSDFVIRISSLYSCV